MSYHGIYSHQRQQLQDQLVTGLLASGAAQSKPWLIFTAGPMGAGYVAHDPLTAGALTHREAGLLVELATEAALKANAHCWVDGSLKDGEWYRGMITKVRRRYPQYSIAILEVCAESAAIFERVARRARETGRDVPREDVLDSIERVPNSVAALCDLCDFSVKIDNSQSTPRLLKYCDAECCYVAKGGNEDLSIGWEELRKRFGLMPEACELKRSVQGNDLTVNISKL